jgi:alpha-D-xyloside xylohydrolase
LQLTHHSILSDAVILETSAGRMILEPYTDCVMHIRYSLKPEFSSAASLVVLPDAKTPVELRVTETDKALIISIPQLSIHVDRQTCAFTYLDAAGQLLTKEPARGGKTLTPVDVYRSIFDKSAPIQARQDVDGVPVDFAHYTREFARKAFHTKLEFEWADGEALYGLGSHEEPMMNLRGQHQYLYQQNMKAVVPVLVSTRGYGILLDSYSLMTFHDDAFGSYLWSDVEDELD